MFGTFKYHLYPMGRQAVSSSIGPMCKVVEMSNLVFANARSHVLVSAAHQPALPAASSASKSHPPSAACRHFTRAAASEPRHLADNPCRTKGVFCTDQADDWIAPESGRRRASSVLVAGLARCHQALSGACCPIMFPQFSVPLTYWYVSRSTRSG